MPLWQRFIILTVIHILERYIVINSSETHIHALSLFGVSEKPRGFSRAILLICFTTIMLYLKRDRKKTCNQTSCRVSCFQLFGKVVLVERTLSNFSFRMGSSEIRMTPSITWLGFKEAPQQLHFRRSKVSAFLCFGITMHWMGVINFCERSLSEYCDSTLSSLTFISQVQAAVNYC